MIPLKTQSAVLALGLVVTTSASRSLAQERGIHVSAARAAAIGECSTLASKISKHTWGATWRACNVATRQDAFPIKRSLARTASPAS